jgi:hypothetical protein
MINLCLSFAITFRKNVRITNVCRGYLVSQQTLHNAEILSKLLSKCFDSLGNFVKDVGTLSGCKNPREPITVLPYTHEY